MKFRKVFTSIALTAAMVAATVSTAWANASYPNVAAAADPYGDFKYTDTVTVSDTADGAVCDFYAMAADSTYDNFASWSEDEVANVTWSVDSISTCVPSGSSIDDIFFVDYMEYDAPIGGYYSMAYSYFIDQAAYGMAVLNVNSGIGGENAYFTVAVNADSASSVSTVTGVRTLFYNTDGSLIVDHTADITGSEFYGSSNYPSVLDAAVSVVGYGNVTSVNATLLASTQIGHGTYGVQSISVNGTETPTAVPDQGWQYRAYDSNGDIINESASIGADQFDLRLAKTIIWKYGAYDSVTFPTSVSGL